MRRPWQRNDEAKAKARRTRFMNGWDAAISGASNPYRREDYRSDFENGRLMCMSGQPLPKWYDEWRKNR